MTANAVSPTTSRTMASVGAETCRVSEVASTSMKRSGRRIGKASSRLLLMNKNVGKPGKRRKEENDPDERRFGQRQQRGLAGGECHDDKRGDRKQQDGVDGRAVPQLCLNIFLKDRERLCD